METNMINSQIIKVNDLTSEHKAAMYALFENYYTAVNPEQFHEDLDSKHYSILLTSDNGKIQGFTTLEIISIGDSSSNCMSSNTPEGIALYSGDTILHRDYWGDQTLPWAWCKLAGEIKAQSLNTPLYWFLIVKGHRTYRYLPVFSRLFYPSHKTVTPIEMQTRMDTLATRKFGNAYKKELGLIKFEQSKGHLNDDFKEVAPHLEKNVHVRFFLDKNKHYDQGDELVCMTELCESNMRFHAKSAFTEGLQTKTPTIVLDL